MRAERPTDAERKVIRWFFGVAFGIAIFVIGWGWLGRRHDCATDCAAKGFQSASLRMNNGGRFNLGTHCECGR